MTFLRWQTLVALAALLAAVPQISAQQRAQRAPRIGYVYPAGVRRGEMCQVTVGGQYLNGAKGALVSGDGVQAALVPQPNALSRKEYNELKNRLPDSNYF